MKETSLFTEPRCIPFLKEIPEIIRLCHEESIMYGVHYSFEQTVSNIGKHFLYWAKMNIEVEDFIKKCKICQSNKPKNPIKMYQRIISKLPFERFVADLWQIPSDIKKYCENSEKKNYVLSVVDHFTRYRFANVISNKEAETVLKYIDLIFSENIRKPLILHTENGKEFKNQLLESFLSRLNIKGVHGKPRKPESQGAVENFNGIIAKAIYNEYNR